MLKLLLINIIYLLFLSTPLCAQKVDSTLENLQQIPVKYITSIGKKATKYSGRITNKTINTLTKLSKWENKIHGIMLKANPEMASRLFGPNQPTFASLLEQVKKGETLSLQYQAQYNKYTDDVSTSLKYLSQQKEKLDSGMLKKVSLASVKIKQLATEEDNSEAMQQFIKERKKQLMQQVLTMAGASKYLTKINKEAFYYTETLKNYKTLFTDSKKAEETGKAILSKIPAFQKFMQTNSQLASLFGSPNEIANGPSMPGLQTRASVQSLIQDRIASGGPNAEQAVQQNIQQAQAELTKLKNKISDALSNGSVEDMPGFKPNMQKTKTFSQRIEYGTNLQFSRTGSLMPATSDIGLSIGYKLNDKSVIGIGGSYKLGMGSIEKISFSNQGASLRSFTDWKLKKQFYISGGFEMNYLSAPSSVYHLPVNAWQQSGLLGVSKKISVKAKFFKETKVQLMYDFLSQRHLPVSQPLLFRVGYMF